MSDFSFFFNIPLVEALPLSQVYLSLPSLAETMVLHTTIAAMRKVDTHRLFVFFFSFSLPLSVLSGVGCEQSTRERNRLSL